MHRVYDLHARTLAGLAGLDGPLPQPPGPFLLAWIEAALPWATEAHGARIIDHYARESVEAWVQRFHLSAEPVRDLVRLDLRSAGTPRLREALRQLFEGARRADIPAGETWGMASAEELLAAAPRVIDLHRRALFGCCQPMVSLGPLEQESLVRYVTHGWALDELLDARLAGHVMHELAHGPAREWSGGPGSWTLHEAAAAMVNLGCQPAHVIAERPGEPVLGLRNAAVLGQVVVEALGPDAVWRLALTATDAAAVVGRRVGHALTAADWQLWARSGPRASFLPPPTRMLAWARLFDVARADPALLPALDRLEQAERVTPDLALGLPDLLAEAEAVPWTRLPGWWAAPGETDREGARLGVATLFQVQRLQPDLQVCPADPPGGEIVLDVASCGLSAGPRRDDPHGLPAEWRFPPALCRVLSGRGATRVVLRGCVAERRAEITERLLDLCEPGRALPDVVEVDLRAPARGTVRPDRTVVPVDPPAAQLHHADAVLTLGSCFASRMGGRLAEGLFEVQDNPFGILYDPISVARALELVSGDQPLPDELLFQVHGRWFSPWHHTAMSDVDRDVAWGRMSAALQAARGAIGRPATVLLTWGTADVWTSVETGEVVANNHGLPAERYHHRRLSVEEIIGRYGALLGALERRRPDLRVVLSVSPIRHLAQGAVGSSRSKATLLLAAHQLAEDHANLSYFPAYEIVMDELRDYRWYEADLVHVSEEAAERIYQRLLDAFVAPSSRWLAREVAEIGRALVAAPRDPLRRRATLDGLLERVAALPSSPTLPRPGQLGVSIQHARAAADAMLRGEAPGSPVVVCEVERPPPPMSPMPAIPDDGLAGLFAALRPGEFISWEAQVAWTGQVQRAVLDVVGPAAAWTALTAVLDKAEELADPTDTIAGLAEPLLGVVLAGASAADARPDMVAALHELLLRGVPRGQIDAVEPTLAQGRPADRRALAALLEGELARREAAGRLRDPKLVGLLARLRVVG